MTIMEWTKEGLFSNIIIHVKKNKLDHFLIPSVDRRRLWKN